MIGVTATASTEAARRDLGTLNAGIHQAVSLAIQSATVATRDAAKATTRFRDRSGETRQSIRSEALPGLRGAVEARGAARFLEDGTKPHDIMASHGQALRFTVNGQTLYRRMVHHPGTAPRPFMHDARDRGETVADYAAEYYVGEAIRRI